MEVNNQPPAAPAAPAAPEIIIVDAPPVVTPVEPAAPAVDPETYSQNVNGRIGNITKKWRTEEREHGNTKQENELLKQQVAEMKALVDTNTQFKNNLEYNDAVFRHSNAVTEGDQVLASSIMGEMMKMQQPVVAPVAPAAPGAPVVAPAALGTQQPVQEQASPQQLAFMARNTWYGPDAIMTASAEAISDTLARDPNWGHRTEADALQEIERQMKQVFPNRFQQTVKPGSPVSPVVNGAAPLGPRTVELTEEQKTIARKMMPHKTPMDAYVSYAKNMEVK